jgi:hypothetical protein
VLKAWICGKAARLERFERDVLLIDAVTWKERYDGRTPA